MLFYRTANKKKLVFDGQFALAMMRLEKDPARIKTIMKIFDEKHDVTPNKYHYAYLIGRAPDRETANRYYKEMVTSGVVADEKIKSILAGKR